jgi:hypothetical protein
MAVTWSPSDKTAGITLSGGNLTATDTTTGNQAVRSVTSNGAGKIYVEWTANTWNGISSYVGIATASAILNNIAFDRNNSFLIQRGTGGFIWFNGSQPSGLPAGGGFATGNIARMAIDLVNKTGWFTTDGTGGGNWNGSPTANPATNTGGIDISALFPINAALLVFATNNNGDAVTINSPLVYAAPFGFGTWDVPITTTVQYVAFSAPNATTWRKIDVVAY